MIANWGLRAALMALFVACVGLYAQRAAATTGWQVRLGASLHVVMALAMIMMVWPLGFAVPALAYVLVFTAAALYFVYLGLFGPAVNHAFFHAVMMAAMVLMAVAMQSALTAGSDMAMKDMTSNPLVQNDFPLWMLVLCGVTAVVFFGVAGWSLYLWVARHRSPSAHAVMSLGMGVMFAAMVI